MDYDDGVDRPVTEETIANERRKSLEWKARQRELEEETRKKIERARAIERDMFPESDSQLGGPHMLETMRGLLDEL